jgi:hypothetical protein
MSNKITPQPEYEALDEFNGRLLEVILPELERWKSDPLIPALGIAGDICEGLRHAGLLRSYSH